MKKECVLSYLILNRSSFIISNKGQKVNLHDLKTGIPSVLNMSEMLALCDKNPHYLTKIHKLLIDYRHQTSLKSGTDNVCG